MAPRRAGQTRRDAALDAMRVLGFKDSLIRKKINELLKVYGKENWAFIEADTYKILLDTIIESIETEEPEQKLVTNVENQSRPNDDILNNNADQENYIHFQPDHTITNQPENHEDTQHVIESEVAPVEEMPEQVLLAEDGELETASDIPICKPCYGWISDGEDDELIFLERSDQ